MANGLIEVKLPKYSLYLKPEEIEKLVIKEPELWKLATKRGKGIKRYKEYESRQSLTTSTVFCLCGSEMVDVNGWESPRGSKFACSNCGHSYIVVGFTIGKVRRARGNENLLEALKDVAFYNRAPEIKENFFEYWRQIGL